jgi:hypothetical protein
MSDHHHYADEVSGVAADGHSHSPGEIGAAEDHDFTMLQRDVGALEAENRKLRGTVQGLERASREQAQCISELVALVSGLTAQTGELARGTAEAITSATSALGAITAFIEQRRI